MCIYVYMLCIHLRLQVKELVKATFDKQDLHDPRAETVSLNIKESGRGLRSARISPVSLRSLIA